MIEVTETSCNVSDDKVNDGTTLGTRLHSSLPPSPITGLHPMSIPVSTHLSQNRNHYSAMLLSDNCHAAKLQFISTPKPSPRINHERPLPFVMTGSAGLVGP